jgi:hypothetical protein
MVLLSGTVLSSLSREKNMKLSMLGLCVAGAAVILLQTGAVVPVSKAIAANTCIKSNVMLYKNRCPVGVKVAAHSAASGGAAHPTVTPTAGPPPTCIKSNVKLYKNRCPVA